MNKKGFTLIELLVVIAIIGILSSVVLASLNSARSKGGDAAVKSNIAGLRAQAELSYDDLGNYSAVCASSTNALAAAKSAAGLSTTNNTTFATEGSAGTITCHATSTGYAIEAPLKTSGFFCIDSTGIAAATTSSALGASDSTCN